ncbi:protein MAIN-LIKE 1-like [Asparagus officinalis]|uniref:protein MAIN-LIKE 1-like n=1 Tax=Asparagus officinalis TaxID=4686 RepID=UPI00098DF7FA|nr:protein MAIN-LIKE 1-like [Asparagus officinalis]
MHIGECTITLQDVAIILGLRIDGPAVTGSEDHNWAKGDIPADASIETFEFHARAYILHMIGCMLFSDASKTLVHARWLPLLQDFGVCSALSWGSAVLAYLYRELGRVSLMQNKEFKGCCTLIQIWSWECIHVGRPTLLVHRDLQGRFPLAYKWITCDPQPSVGHMSRPPTDSYIPSGMIERDYVHTFDSIEDDIDAHMPKI